MATSHIALDTGSTLKTATHTISEDAVTKHIPRSVLSIADGTDHGIATNPIYVIPSGGISAISGTVAVTGSVTIANAALTVTGSTVIISLPAITGSVSVISIPAITGSVAVVSMPTTTVTGSVVVISTPAITGSVSVVTMPTVTITGSTTVVGTVSITGSTTIVGTVTVTSSNTLIHINFPSRGTSVLEVTTAGTSTLVASHATLRIYLTDLIISNGAAAGSIKFGETNTTTTGNLKIGSLYVAVNGGMATSFMNPIQLTAVTPFVMTAVSCTTLSATATYYYAA